MSFLSFSKSAAVVISVVGCLFAAVPASAASFNLNNLQIERNTSCHLTWSNSFSECTFDLIRTSDASSIPVNKISMRIGNGVWKRSCQIRTYEDRLNNGLNPDLVNQIHCTNLPTGTKAGIQAIKIKYLNQVRTVGSVDIIQAPKRKTAEILNVAFVNTEDTYAVVHQTLGYYDTALGYKTGFYYNNQKPTLKNLKFQTENTSFPIFNKNEKPIGASAVCSVVVRNRTIIPKSGNCKPIPAEGPNKTMLLKEVKEIISCDIQIKFGTTFECGYTLPVGRLLEDSRYVEPPVRSIAIEFRPQSSEARTLSRGYCEEVEGSRVVCRMAPILPNQFPVGTYSIALSQIGSEINQTLDSGKTVQVVE